MHRRHSESDQAFAMTAEPNTPLMEQNGQTDFYPACEPL
jgi:hypothetical protein